MKLTKSILLICLYICLLDSIISLTKIQIGSKKYLRHLILKKNRITKSSSRFQKKNLQAEDLETFLKQSLINFKNRNELYKKTDPTGKEFDTDKQGIIYESTKSLNYKNQFFNDIIMVYKTFYPENSYAKQFLKIDESKIQDPNSKFKINYSVVASLKRILFFMIDQGLYYSREENKVFFAEEKKEENLWKYPLASSICHGSRTIFLYNKDKLGGKDLFPQYFFGQDNILLKPRSTASHKMQYDPTTNKYEEKKILLEAALDYGKSYFITKHQGMNIPLGGIGNIWPDMKTIINSQGFGNKWENGQIVDTYYEPLQAGHLYVRLDSLEGSPYASIMMGLEEEMPGYKGMFSDHVHNLFNAFQAPSTAVCGGSKWKELGQLYLNNDVPNNYGGKAVFFDDMPNTDVLDKIENYKKDIAKKVWWIILSSDTKMYKQFKEKYLMKLTEVELDAKFKSIIQ